MDAATFAKLREKCVADGTAKLKFHGDAKVRQALLTRRREVVSQWEHAPCTLSAEAGAWAPYSLLEDGDGDGDARAFVH